MNCCQPSVLTKRCARGAPAAPAKQVQVGHFDHLVDHVIFAGYGDMAARLVPVLAERQIPLVVATLSPWGASEAEEAGHPVLPGDYTRAHASISILALESVECSQCTAVRL